MKKPLLILLLVVILGNVVYWVLNKKFLHEELIAMVTGKPSAPPLVFEQESQVNAASAAQALVNAAAPDAADASEDPVAASAGLGLSLDAGEPAVLSESQQMQTMISELQAEIDALQAQTVEISNTINTLNTESEVVDQTIQEIGSNYQLSPAQLEQVLSENLAEQAIESALIAE